MACEALKLWSCEPCRILPSTLHPHSRHRHSPSLPLLRLHQPSLHLAFNASSSSMATILSHPPSPSSLKARLSAGHKLYGAFLLSFSPVVAEILGWSGYDYVVVDMEHGPGDFFAAIPVLQALASTGTPAIIRIPANDPALAKKALDLGPAGIMIPMIDSPEAARKAVAACRFPPRGIRGAAYPVVRASRYGLDPHYLEKCEEELLIMVQVESKQAVECIKEIASVDGVDCIQMGPTDLSADIGFLNNPGDAKAKALLLEAEKAALASGTGVYLGAFTMPDDPPEACQERGYHMVAGAVDIGLLRNAALADVKKNKPTYSSSTAAV